MWPEPVRVDGNPAMCESGGVKDVVNIVQHGDRSSIVVE